MRELKIGIVGLGYVGLPLAIAFGKVFETVGFDVQREKVDRFKEGIDPTGEVELSQFNAAARLTFSASVDDLDGITVFVIAVPTPIDEAKRPNLTPLASACELIGPFLRSGSVVVFESTVYPGCTEEVCAPILEQSSGLPWSGRYETITDDPGFYLGYSPERINPGDKENRLESIIKVVAGDTVSTLDLLESAYASVIEAGVYRAPSIKVAEAAKVIENTQRDLNIALMNELSMIFDRLGIDTLDVIDTASTKWNFLPFRPGLVGGHCIGVDPYYLTHKAQSIGMHPEVILSGRRTNDYMGGFVARATVKQLAARNISAVGVTVTVLGLAFKENCSDLRNSKVPDVISELEEYGCRVQVCDPLVDPDAAKDLYSIELTPLPNLEVAQAIVIAVAHDVFRDMSCTSCAQMLEKAGIIIDVKGVVDRISAKSLDLEVWRL